MAGSDDLLDPQEIEALLKEGGNPPSQPDQPREGGERSRKDLLDASEIEALLKQSGTPVSESSAPSSAGFDAQRLIDQAEADLAAAVASELDPASSGTPYEFREFDSTDRDETPAFGLQALSEVELNLHVELGRAELLIQEVLNLKEGSVVPLDKLAGDPVDILVNGRLVARGEVLVLNDSFCVRVAEILSPEL